MEEAKQALDTVEDGEMEGYPNISVQSDEGSLNISVQADECKHSISANTSDQTDDGSHNISVVADERNPDPDISVEVHLNSNPDISVEVHLNSNPNDSVETNLDTMEESRQNEETLSAYSSLNEADKAPKYTIEATCNPKDEGYGEGRPACDANGTDKERGKAEESVLANRGLPNDPSNPDPNDAGDQMIPVNEGSCEMAASNVHMQEEPPWSGGVIVDAFGAELESQEGNRRLSLKRPRPSCLNNTPSVQVVYNCLTSESKNKLKELLQEWAEWHGKCVGSKEEADKTSLKSGDEMYFPALQIGGGSKATMSFWMDKPSKHARTENATVELTPENQDREKDVPLYDRATIGALISQETETSIEGGLERVDEGSRCFNCGSYSHSLKECPRPRDNTAINNARKLLAEKRGSTNGSRAASRYYQSSPGGKFDDLKPGFLGSETRQLLGIGELDPPPWLNRMRELGYPPGYLEGHEDEPSGITIFGTSEDSAEGSFIGEDGEIVWDSGKKKSVSQKMIVSFPGVNAPIPDDADQHTWGSPAHHNGHGRASYRVTGRTGHSSSFSAAALTSDGTVYTRTDDWEAPPGTGHDSYMKSSKIRSPSFEGASVVYNKTSPWQPNEQGRSGIAASSRSPYLGRSSSESGRRSPKVPYDEPHTLPPLGGPSSGSRQSPMHSLRPYPRSPSTPSQRLPYGQEYREDGLESRQRAWAQAHGALQSMHHNGLHSPSRHRSTHF